MTPRNVFSNAKQEWRNFWKGKMKRGRILEELIRGVEESSGQDRTDARAKAKVWLISHVSSMNRHDIDDARSHFGYLLPAEWGIT